MKIPNCASRSSKPDHKKYTATLPVRLNLCGTL
jgi:hypothetical protein